MINLVFILRRFQLFKTVIKLCSYKIRVIHLFQQFQGHQVIHNLIKIEKYNLKII